tara:strand:+ start:2891 stop:3505 length:615 start_codon:yes stop_codon:yes gene_type:complete
MKMNIRENLKNNIEALKKIAFNEVVEEVVETTESKFVDAQLEDGTIINVEPAIELGASVSVMTEQGIVAAEDAEHTLASGEKIITVGGVITEIIETEEEEVAEEVEEEVEVEEEMESADLTAPTPKTVIERTEVERKFAELESKIADAIVKNEEFEKKVISTLEEFAKEPSVEPTKKRKLNAFKKDELSFEDKIKRINNLRKIK